MNKKQNTIDDIIISISWWSLVILIFIIPFRLEHSYHLKNIFTTLLIIVCIGTVTIVRKKGWSRGPIDSALLLYVFIAIIASLFSICKLYSFQAILHNLIPIVIIYFALWQHLRYKNKVISILWTMILSSILAILLSFLDKGFKGTRLTGIFGCPTNFARYLDLLIPLTLSLAFYYRKNIAYFIGLISLSIIQLICLFLTGTRASIISLGSVLLGFSFFKKKLWFIAIGIIMIFFIILLTIPKNSEIRYRLIFWTKSPEKLISKDESLKIRKLYYKTVIALIKERPIIGWGYGTRTVIYASSTKSKIWYQKHGGIPVPHHAHSIYLQILLETGILGFIACIWIWLSAIYQLVKELKNNLNSNNSILILGCIAALIAISIHSIVSIPCYKTTMELIVVIFICAINISSNSAVINSEKAFASQKN